MWKEAASLICNATEPPAGEPVSSLGRNGLSGQKAELRIWVCNVPGSLFFISLGPAELWILDVCLVVLPKILVLACYIKKPKVAPDIGP